MAMTSNEELGEAWYFDSGCSRHMTGRREYLDKVKTIKGGNVTFGVGGQGKIIGKGETVSPKAPNLKNIYLAEDLKANLISVIELCDQGMRVVFTQSGCRAIDKNKN